MIDNLSGSVFHHYSSPPVCKDCRSHPQEQIKLAEVEQASLMSEQLSDKSSSLALPDDLSLDEHSNYQLLVRDSQQGSSDSHSSEELPASGGYRGLRRCSSGSEDGDHERFEEGIQAEVDTLSPACCADGDGRSCGADAGGSSPLFRTPAEVIHPSAAAHPGGPEDTSSPGDREPPQLASPPPSSAHLDQTANP
ncbi:hypothetical protein fugu_007634 [Takifugu bimaculatus]|nr:hypothetical protein fugu_007634 [Takifugu bimaculatus]